MLIRQFIVHKNERGLLFKNGDFTDFLMPGTYNYFDPFKKIQIEIYDLSVPEFQHRWSDFILKECADAVESHFSIIELSAQQLALIFKNGILADILPPSTRTIYWKGIIDITAEIIDISTDFAITPENRMRLMNSQTGIDSEVVAKSIYSETILEHQIGLLYVDGKYSKTLSAGLHAYWKFNRKLEVKVWDTRLQTLEVAGQELLTKDKVSLRINLSANYIVKDVLLLVSTLNSPINCLYKELQFGIRAAVGTRSLDELLEDKNIIDELVFAYITKKTAEWGIKIESVGVKDIILPGDMKTILSKVVEAEKSAQANLIKRREETAATRSLLNTAKVMEDNPTALRLKELEVLEKVTEKIGSISVYGGLEGLLKELVKINPFKEK
jgi:regulator of protease activity HflC (stomatin/prohibitin superfamily)